MIKKLFIFATLIGALFFTSCDKEEVFYTEVVELAGEWIVSVDVVDADGSIIEEDYWGPFDMLTYNTVDNNNEMWLDDLENFWSTKVKVVVDVKNSTFTCNNYTDEYLKGTEWEYQATITDGKVNYDGTVSSMGHIVDEIVFTIEFSDDPGTYYRFHGYRRTGFDQGAD